MCIGQRGSETEKALRETERRETERQRERLASCVTSSSKLTRLARWQGASTGIGRALALRFAARGFDLTLAARNTAALAATVAAVAQTGDEQTQQRATAHATDVTCPDAVATLVSAHLARCAGLDVLVVCAGAGHHGLCTDNDLQVHRALMDLNYFGALHCIQAALPALLDRDDASPLAAGRILAIGSVSGEVGLPLRSAYCASKHALSGYLESLDREMAMRHLPLKVTNVAPNSVNTGFHKQGRRGAPPKMTADECADKCMAAFDSGRSGTVFIPGYMRSLTVLPRAVTDVFIARHERSMLDGVVAHTSRL